MGAIIHVPFYFVCHFIHVPFYIYSSILPHLILIEWWIDGWVNGVTWAVVVAVSFNPVLLSCRPSQGTVTQTAWSSTSCSRRWWLTTSAWGRPTGTPAGGSDSGWRCTDVLTVSLLWIPEPFTHKCIKGNRNVCLSSFICKGHRNVFLS